MTGMPNSDKVASFSHDQTGFPLDGRHATTNCRDCHETLVFDAAPSDCVACHTDIHQRTVGNDCNRCHTADNWLVDDVQGIHFDNGFPLNGVHTNVSCVACHISETTLRFDRRGNDCISCHAADFQATMSPNHVEAGFSMECTTCHDVFTPGWTSSSLSHDFFPLTMGHAISDCFQCHTNGGFTDTPTACVACHQPEYNATTQPNHRDAGIGTDCAQCHTTAPGWMPARFDDHDQTAFPLRGAHTQTDCVACHADGFAGTPTACVACHQADYDNANSPDHSAAQFPTSCADCHTETAWTPANFDHDDMYFPIYSGNHRNEWDDCRECHTTPGNYALFSCVECHEHDDAADLADEHQGINGYQYLSTACYACHPDGDD